ncbi:hypothetical protein [Roseateles amylovorans]|uniref:Uncharacterized protein n=1 Tax=Roseateles amylovorans TaxID=2978473 RepID=A0ABY6AWI0_9BURK|nr:hypothetical protein [Roseateles amylovorans]UXH76176.1 hypothetical protein N4261_13945 [Roseateles amylovorans]
MKFVLIMALALLASCKQHDSPKFNYDESLPFGVWSAGGGRVILIDRKHGYALCDRAQCERGSIRKNGVFGIYLNGFWQMNTAKELLKKGAAAEADLDFTESGVGPDIRNGECRGLPCVAMGSLDASHITFVKIEDW